MPSFQKNSDFCDNLVEPKIWKIVPGFLRKKSQNEKPPEEVTKKHVHKTASETVISENDEGSVLVTDPDYIIRENEDAEDHHSSIRPLQRGESLPGKLAAGTLSKHEAKRRLMSWRKTTIVRKNSEQ